MLISCSRIIVIFSIGSRVCALNEFVQFGEIKTHMYTQHKSITGL